MENGAIFTINNDDYEKEISIAMRSGRNLFLSDGSILVHEHIVSIVPITKESKPKKQEYIGINKSKTPSSFMLDGYRVPVTNWIHILYKTCEYLYENEYDFVEKVGKELNTDKITFISRDKEDIKQEFRKKLSGDIFIYKLFDSEHAVKRSKQILELFGYSTDLKIEYKEGGDDTN